MAGGFALALRCMPDYLREAQSLERLRAAPRERIVRGARDGPIETRSRCRHPSLARGEGVIVETDAGKQSASLRRVTVPIYGLACGGGGALTAERALARVPGVARAYVNPLTEMAYVEYDPAIAQPAQLADAVERAGLRAGEPSLR